jgi:hypothetical protein
LHDNKIPAGLPEDGVTSWREAEPVVLAERDTVRADA